MAETQRRILLAGTRSGSGKTTVTVALIAALRARGLPVTTFKCGPDYIDPTFHRSVLGVTSHNLDPFFSSPQSLRDQVVRFGEDHISVIEGVMGYYDGLGASTRASTFDVASATKTPVVLILDARGMAASVGALLSGFMAYRTPSLIEGVIINQVPAGMYSMYEDIVRQVGLTPLGFLPHADSLTIPDRHLGLVMPDEIRGIDQMIASWGELAEEHIDIDTVLDLASRAADFSTVEKTPLDPAMTSSDTVRIGVARDDAFCFMYAETLELLEKLGCEIVFFSPISDPHLPERIGGLYLPGGYPENHLTELSSNSSLRQDIRSSIEAGLPTIAECGGFMYLHRDIDGIPMVGVIDGSATMTDRLQRFGYATLTTTTDSLLGEAGTTIPVHEFHYGDSTANGSDFTATKASTGTSYACGHASPTMYAGFPHLYLPAVVDAAQRFVSAARTFAAHPSPMRGGQP